MLLGFLLIISELLFQELFDVELLLVDEHVIEEPLPVSYDLRSSPLPHHFASLMLPWCSLNNVACCPLDELLWTLVFGG